MIQLTKELFIKRKIFILRKNLLKTNFREPEKDRKRGQDAVQELKDV
jgi:hypothetical protein